MKQTPLLLAYLLLSCQVNQQAVQDQVYACDPKAVDPGCGTDRQSRPMMCFAGRTLGGTDFCAERCPEGASLEPGVCAQSGALLATCDPATEGSCGNPALGCFRNNVLADGGVCMTINPCNGDQDCRDPVRSVCATSLVQKIYAEPASFKNDHLWCLQAGCQERRTACSPGETCLRDVIPSAAHPPDICVPNCDSNLRCPPAHFCYRKVSGRKAPNICSPGLLGFRCESSIDCMMGECTDTGHGFNVCTTPCGSDTDCARFDGEQGKFLCNEEHRCVTPDAFRGSTCEEDGDCQSGLTCAYLSADSPTGNCMPPCGAGGACATRGGIPHTCLPRGDASLAPVCYPGYFGLPCTADTQCLPGLSCRAAAAGQPRICTSLCADDADCGKNRWSAAGYCQELKDMGIKLCLGPRAAGAACDRDAQCTSKKCVARPDGTRACTPPPGGRT
jgi:hypothetical protein